ncbi:hypothetical protein JEZ13_05000 [bacterium]|nr:hypothetical protein [bacterium]
MKDPYKIENKVLSDLIDNVYEIIKDYRAGEDDCMQKWHIIRWINQFDSEDDRIFILKELKHLLPNSYLSRQDAEEFLISIVDDIKDTFSIGTTENFFKEVNFILVQKEDKSQQSLLNILRRYSIDNFNIAINCSSDIGSYKYHIYIDDVVATGGTLYKDLKSFIKINKDSIFKKGIKIIPFFICYHNWGLKNTFARLEYSSKEFHKIMADYYFSYVILKNDPREEESNKLYNLLYPIKSEIGQYFLDNIGKYFDRNDWRNEEYAFREEHLPLKEDFFSSPENRLRYEEILLKKGIEIMDKTVSLSLKSIRPLGCTLLSNKTLGTGTHFFTWRNISNTCPLVFWYSGGDWKPLFKKRNY